MLPLNYLSDEKLKHVTALALSRTDAMGNFDLNAGYTGTDVGILGFLDEIEGINSTERRPEIALLGAVESLSKDELGDLIAVMWVGRNTEGEQAEPFDSVVRRGRVYADLPGAIPYIVGKTPVGIYLRAGREFLLDPLSSLALPNQEENEWEEWIDETP